MWAIQSVQHVISIDDKQIGISFKENYEEKLFYMCDSKDDCSEIVAKLNFVIVSVILLPNYFYV